jgi:hypothetical protein
MRFFAWRGVRNRDSKRWAIEQTAQVVEGAERFAASWGVDRIEPIVFSTLRKEDIAPVADSLLRHALMTGTGDRVLRYLGRPQKPDGTPRSDMGHDVVSSACFATMASLVRFHAEDGT